MKSDIITLIIAYESGELSNQEMLELFGRLIKSGECWNLQGHYGRTASSLIASGFITEDGDLTI
jgi:hypothetical protein